MIRVAIPLVVMLVGCFTACTARPSLEAKPQTRLIGKWEDTPSTKGGAPSIQFEFLADGTAIENQYVKLQKKWNQLGAGNFKFMDASHLKIELQPNWYFGIAVYEVTWQDQDHLTLRAGDKTIQLVRIKPSGPSGSRKLLEWQPCMAAM